MISHLVVVEVDGKEEAHRWTIFSNRAISPSAWRRKAVEGAVAKGAEAVEAVEAPLRRQQGDKLWGFPAPKPERLWGFEVR